MTIKEIAKLAGVSISTVSKIMNNKDESISAETREHVLRIAKDYNYKPYASVISPRNKSLIIGVLVRNTSEINASISGILASASNPAAHGSGKSTGFSRTIHLQICEFVDGDGGAIPECNSVQEMQ